MSVPNSFRRVDLTEEEKELYRPFFHDFFIELEEARKKGIRIDPNFIHSVKLKYSRRHHLRVIPPNANFLEYIIENVESLKERSVVINEGLISSGASKEVPAEDNKVQEVEMERAYKAYIQINYINYYRKLLRTKPMRTLSGVAVVAVMTSPAECPHGTCIYCPGGVKNSSPQSYTGREPAAMRARMYDYDPYRQTYGRLNQLYSNGHPVDKVDLIVMGGTFSSRPRDYQEYFIRRCFEAMNDFPVKRNTSHEGLDNNLNDNKTQNNTLEQVHSINEKASTRCVGLTLETRPDCCTDEEIDNMLRLGCTRVEIGVQTVFEDILQFVKRGHGIKEVIEATRRLKDAGLKVCYHMMPGLPGMTPEKDFESFKRVFADPDFRPDMLKIYPTLVMEGTPLCELYRAGNYMPYTEEETVKLLAKVKEIIPEWIRIQRIERDIPTNLITAGIFKSNLRELVKKRLDEDKKRCRCIRCREVGHVAGCRLDKTFLKVEEYIASDGKEMFLSVVDEESDALLGYARFRRPSSSAKREELQDIGPEECAFLRELKVLGQMAPLGAEEKVQHQGYGRMLVKKGEELAVERWNTEKMLVTSAVGTREYYRKLGYERDGRYMSRKIC